MRCRVSIPIGQLHINPDSFGWSSLLEQSLVGGQASVDKFFQVVDASCLMHNASTRFNDGGELGLGAELGISTTKIHAYGPMGAEEMTSSRFIVLGSGQVRS